MTNIKYSKLDFIEKVSGAPLCFSEVACIAIQCSDREIANVGLSFLICRKWFDNAETELMDLLDSLDIELG